MTAKPHSNLSLLCICVIAAHSGAVPYGPVARKRRAVVEFWQESTMTVDHLPTSPVELPELPDHDEEGGNVAESATVSNVVKLPRVEPSADATEADWPQTGFGSFP